MAASNVFMMSRRAVYFSSVAVALMCIALTADSARAALSCSVTTTCAAPNVVVMRLAFPSGGLAELPSQSTYSDLVCCSGAITLGNFCSGTFGVAANLSAATAATAEQNSLGNYTQSACLSVAEGTVTIGYQADSCTGYDTTLASMSATTNATVGDASAYANKICGSVTEEQTVSFSISHTALDFGQLSVSSARYATNAGGGSGTATDAHQLVAATTAQNGYVITVQGGTLTNGLHTITAIGGTNTASAPGTEQFGMRLTSTGGYGAVSAPYGDSGYAYAATASTTSTIATSSAASAATTFAVRYMANISTMTEPGTYTTAITYVMTGRF